MSFRRWTCPPFLTSLSYPSALSTSATDELLPARLWDPIGTSELLPVCSQCPQEPKETLPGQSTPQGQLPLTAGQSLWLLGAPLGPSLDFSAAFASLWVPKLPWKPLP